MGTVRRLVSTARAGLGRSHQRARVRAIRDFNAYLRLQCVGALSRSGLATALATPGTASDLARRAGLSDVDLTAALLDLGVSVRQVRRRNGMYSLRGALLRAVASGDAADVEGLVEEVVSFDNPMYAALEQHLRGLGPRPYDAELGDVVAKVSRLAEPVLGPWLQELARTTGARTVLDVGCGSGVYLGWMADALPRAELVGIDADARAVAAATRELDRLRLGRRVRIQLADLDAMPPELAGPWDLIVLSNNVYYWPVEERADLLRRLRGLTAGQGTVVAVTAIPAELAVVRNLDLVLRVSTGCYRLPTREELSLDAKLAGFSDVDVTGLAPGLGMVALVARS